MTPSENFAKTSPSFLVFLTFVCLFTGPALAQREQPDVSKIEVGVTDVGHHIYALSGYGGNVTVAVGTDGIIMVDAQYAPMHDKLKAKIASLSPLPIKYLINTHYHADHTGGNELFAKDGAIIVAYESVGKRMGKVPAAALPVQTYAGMGTEVKIPGQTAELVHQENAHTDGDTIVFWPSANVISSGDIIVLDAYPNMSVATGAGIDGMIAGANFIAAHADAKTKIIPGHGPITDRKTVIAYGNMLKTARNRIAKAKIKGMSEDQVVKAHLLADLDKKWAANDPQADRFPSVIYRSIK